jgi:hypothetical protein
MTVVLPSATYTDADLIEPGVVPVRLPDVLAPPPWRWRVAHTRCHTVQTTGLPDTLDTARTQFLATQDRIAAWISANNLAAYPRGNDPEPIVSAHLSAAGAQALADELGSMWGERRALYDVTLPIALAARHELGEAILIVSSAAGFEQGRAAVIVSEQMRTAENTATLRVLV